MNARPVQFFELNSDERRMALIRVATRLANHLDPAAAATFAAMLEESPNTEVDAATFRWLREP